MPDYKRLLERFSQNEAPVSLAATAFTLPDPGLIAEDIDYDARSASFLVTSILEHKIIRLRLDGSVSDFAASPDHWPIAALKIDAAHHRVWATEVAFDGFAAAPQSAWGRSAVLCFDLDRGKLLRRVEGPPRVSFGDMVLSREGDPNVSDGDGGGLYRLANDAMTEINRTDFISPQTPALGPYGKTLLVPDYLRGIAALDLDHGQASWLNQDGADKIALNGVDGLYVWRHSLILTQNGTSPERVIIVQLDPSLTHVVSSKIIAQSTPDFGDPTHGVVVGNDFYFIANSGWDRLDEHGNVKPGAKLTPARILRYKLD